MRFGFVLCVFLTVFPVGFLFPQEVSVWFNAANLLHFGDGEIGAIAAGANLSGKVDFSISAAKLTSTIDVLRFSAEAVSASVRFPIKTVSISADVTVAALRNIEIYNTATCKAMGVIVTGVSSQIPLFKGAALSPFLKVGRLCAIGGKAYGFKAVPEIPAFCLFGTLVSFPVLTVLMQGGLFDVSVRSEAASSIESSGFQRQFLLLCTDRVGIGKATVSWWGGMFYTDGMAAARTERGDISFRVEDRFFALGTGAEVAFKKGRFFGAAGLHALFMPFGFATAKFAYDAKLFFTEIHQKFNFAFDSESKYGLLLPRISGGIRLHKRGRIFIEKTFYVPLVFSATSSGGGDGASSSNGIDGTDAARLVATVLLSGISFGIRI